ncbi:MAG: transcriptional repressor LexA [Candidatus Gastranaerophilales bacterium]|nr:transcriptional repressor LexA [Candidatus Gastranaerophilales bacterium]
MITQKQKDFLEKLKDKYGREPLPSFEKICEDLGFKSKNSIWQYFKKLLEYGHVKERDNRFFLDQGCFGIPYFQSGVKAGFPSPAEDCMDETLSFDTMLVKNPASTFCIRVSGDSMIDAGIHENDIVIVQKGREVQNGDIVIAFVDGEFTVKYYKKHKGEILLEPANKNYPVIKAKQELQIFGIVTGVVRQLKI